MNQKTGQGKGLLLIHPPAAKICEAPGGPARLAGALRRRGILCRLWDANLEGQLALLDAEARIVNGGFAGAGRAEGPPASGAHFAEGEAERMALPGTATGTWTRGAARRLAGHLAALRSWGLYGAPDRYRRAVTDVNRLLMTAAKPYGVRLSLADYEDRRLSPVKSADLLSAAAAPEANPFHAWFAVRLPELLAEGPFSHVGFSLNYLSQALTSFAMIGFLKRKHPRLRIVLGGGLVTSWMRGLGRRNLFPELADDMIAGPGEIPLSALLGTPHDGGDDRPDLDGFPPDDYLAPGMILPYSASGGCWWRRCSFCPEQAEGNPYRPLPPDRVTADLRDLVRRWQPALIHLLDNALSPALLKALTLSPPGAPWYGFARITAELADREFCRRLRAAGCVMLKLGLESGDQGVLDALGKGFPLALAAAALENLREAGIATYVYLLFGTPAETPAAARRTLNFTVAHGEAIGFLNLAIFNLPACGSEAAQLTTGEFYPGDLSLYRSFTHPRGWQRGAVRRFLETEFKKDPTVAAILRRDPPFFTSNHAPLLALAGRGRAFL
ncbi:MAG: B12-binding domain-containing radical SAM protein [Deltaproteobacteria bacterium]|nr:B12-binding domain-containing radical SAM protein [Deltaproteobacteria bacterium]